MLPFHLRSRLDHLPTTARFFSMKFQAQGSEAGVARIKHNKIPRKLASKVMHELRWEQVQNPLPFPKFRVGDAVEVKMLPYKSASAAVVMRGVVLSKVNKGIDSAFIIRDVFLGDVIERRISLHAPLIQDITVLQRSFIHKGKKRVRRSKLFYLRDRDPLFCKVSKQ
mmetsp:Transcript_24587/g.50459  ORF Transcript_24587/g.50459 Transcript_24587/m.50459 type:complete len:167 (+) Transcript_24587:76-576(+)